MKKLWIITIAIAMASAPSILRAADSDVSIRVVNHTCTAALPFRAMNTAEAFQAMKNLKNFRSMMTSCTTDEENGTRFMVRAHGMNGMITDYMPGRYVKSEICEWELQGGDDKETSRACYDNSYYEFDNIPKGTATVMESEGAAGKSIGIVGFNPEFLNGNDPVSLVSFGPNVVNLNTTRDNDGIVTLHVFHMKTTNGADGGTKGAAGTDGEDGLDGLDSGSIRATIDANVNEAIDEAVDVNRLERALDKLQGIVSNFGGFFSRT